MHQGKVDPEVEGQQLHIMHITSLSVLQILSCVQLSLQTHQRLQRSSIKTKSKDNWNSDYASNLSTHLFPKPGRFIQCMHHSRMKWCLGAFFSKGCGSSFRTTSRSHRSSYSQTNCLYNQNYLWFLLSSNETVTRQT